MVYCTFRDVYLAFMRSILFAPVLLLLPAVRLAADVRLPCVFSDHMVLTRAQAVPVWGDADPGEEVVVTFEGKTVRTTAGTSGKWMVHLADSLLFVH